MKLLFIYLPFILFVGHLLWLGIIELNLLYVSMLILIIIDLIQLHLKGPGLEGIIFIYIKDSQERLEILIAEEVQALMKDELRFQELLKENEQRDNNEIEGVIMDEMYRRVLVREGMRECKHCQGIKGQRTHHCRQCRVCILRMDHHCQWFNICVGKNNYKYFFQILIFHNVILLASVYSFYKYQDILNVMLTDIQLLYQIFTFLSLICLLVVTIPLFIFHIILICMNKTTIEFLEKKESYYVTLWSNWKEMLGNSWYLWFIPI